MVEYSVMLKRFPGSARPDLCIFRDEDREKAIAAMRKYDRENGFSVEDRDGRFTIANIVLVAREPIAGAPVLSETPWSEIFDVNGQRKEVRA